MKKSRNTIFNFPAFFNFHSKIGLGFSFVLFRPFRACTINEDSPFPRGAAPGYFIKPLRGFGRYDGTGCVGDQDIDEKQPTGNQYTTNTLSDGDHSFKVKAEDNADNWGGWSICQNFTVSTCTAEDGSCSSDSECCSGLKCVDGQCTSCKTSGYNLACSDCRACSNTDCTGGCYWDNSSNKCLKDGYYWRTSDNTCQPGLSECSPDCSPWNANCYSACTSSSYACCEGTRYGESGAWCGLPGDWNSPSVVVCTTSNPC